MSGAHPGRRAGQVAGQRHQRERSVLTDFANRDSGAQSDERLLDELGAARRRWAGGNATARRVPTHETMTTVAAMAVSIIVGARLRDTSRCYVCF